MIMNAVVIDVQWGRLLVLDLDTRQRVIVNLRETGRLNPGDLVRIWYNGVMTNSIPPQISAQRIVVLPQEPFQPCPPTVCPPVIRPPAVLPPVILPPIFPPFRPPMGPGGPGRPGRPGPGRPR